MSFLAEVAQDLYQTYRAAMAQCTVIFPHQKALAQFRKCMATVYTQELSTLYTLEEWVVTNSQLQVPSTMELIIRLYKLFQQHLPSPESLDHFYGWGTLLLQDFDILDRCLVDPSQLFANLYQQRVLDATYDPLTEAQKEAIQAFWKTFERRSLSSQQDYFLQMAQLLPVVYSALREQLQADGLGYVGLCYRKVVDSPAGGLKPATPYLAIVGFNALHPAEEKLFAWWHNQLPTAFYWDIDAYYMDDEKQEAGHYLRSHRGKPYFQDSFKRSYAARIKNQAKTIQYFECNTTTAQAQVIVCELEKCLQKKNAKPHQIVIVLASGMLLVPLATAWTRQLPPFVSTLGYPVTQTTSYQLAKQLLQLQIARQQPACPTGYWPAQEVIHVLQHPLMQAQQHQPVTATIQHIQSTSSPYISQQLLPHEGIYQTLWEPLAGALSVASYLVKILTYLRSQGSPVSPTHPPLLSEQVALAYIREQLQQLPLDLFLTMPLERFLQLFIQLMQDVRLPLEGPSDTAPSISIMQIGETANLDFDYVFMLGMNEGAFPATPTHGSFIPYNLRKGYQLPTFDTFEASLHAYHFYRLLQRAQQVYITYNTPTQANGQKEMSRYLWQLRYESQLPIQQHKLQLPIVTPRPQPLIIKKDASVLALLAQFTHRPGQVTPRSFTPMALNTYLDCSLRFYFRYVLALQPPPTTTEAMRFGNLLHQVMEKLYTGQLEQSEQNTLQPVDIAMLKKRAKALISQVFAPYHPAGATLVKDQELIEQAVMEKIVDQLLTLDQQQAPFVLLGVEIGKNTPLKANFTLNTHEVVVLQGIIDRVDVHQGSLRIIDYKTGHDDTSTPGIGHLFHHHDTKRNKALLQLFLYAWLIKQQPTYAQYTVVVPHLIRTSSIFEPNFDPRLFIQAPLSKTYIPIADVTPYQPEFEQELASLITAILDPAIPFVQTDNHLTCTQCPYQRICERY